MRHPKYALSYRAKPVTHTFNAQNNLNLNNEHELAFKNHMPAKRLIEFYTYELLFTKFYLMALK